MEHRVLDTTSLRSSGTDEDLEEARQRLLVHQEENATEYTAPLPQRQPCDNQTRYGSMSTLQSSQAKRTITTIKRYRLPFLILLVFDWGLVVFLSIICSVTPLSVALHTVGANDSRSGYFDLDIEQNYFDLVLIATGRCVLNMLFYLVLGWVTRIVMGLLSTLSTMRPQKSLLLQCTTLVSALYVPVKAYYCWQQVTSNVLGQIPILLMLLVSFVMPWIIAFFFEFKYLPSELSRLSISSWYDWRAWLWPSALARAERTDTPSLPDVTTMEVAVPTLPRPPRHTASSLSLDFRTPVGSSRASPVQIVDRHGDEELPPIREESLELPSPEAMSAEDRRFKREGLRALETLEALTRSHDGWTLETATGAIQCFSQKGEARKIWKGESMMDVGVGFLWRILYPGETISVWSPQCSLSETFYRVDETTDIVYSISKAIGPVSSRDFVSVRQIAVQGGCYFSATMATNTSLKPEQPGKVRAENGPCGYKLVPVDASRTRLVWIINTDLKGWLPQRIIDQSLSGALLTSIQRLQEYVAQQKTEGTRR